MSKITKKQLQESHNKLLNQFASLVRELKVNNVIDDSVCPTFTKKTEPQLKQLDQSIFNGLDEKWRFAMVSSVGIPFVYDYKPTGMRAFLSDSSAQLMVNLEKVMRIDEYDYDTSNWQNSLIERDDTAKELLEIDLSSELTGSELCRAMINRGDKIVLCIVKDYEHEDYTYYDAITHCSGNCFESSLSTWGYAIPINNQGEPLTAAEAGL